MMKRNFVTAQMKKLLVLFLALMMMVSGTLFVYAAEFPDDNDAYVWHAYGTYGLRANYYDLYMNKDGTWSDVVMDWSGGAGAQSNGVAADNMVLETWLIFNGNNDPRYSGDEVAERIAEGTAGSSGIVTERESRDNGDAYMIRHTYSSKVSIMHSSFSYRIYDKDIVTKQEYGTYACALVNGRTYKIQAATNGKKLPDYPSIPVNGEWSYELDGSYIRIVEE